MKKSKSRYNKSGLPDNFIELGISHIGKDGQEIPLIISRNDGIFEIKVNGNIYKGKTLSEATEKEVNLFDVDKLEDEIKIALNGSMSEIKFENSNDNKPNDDILILDKENNQKNPHPIKADSKFLQNWGVGNNLDLFDLGIDGVRKEYAVEYYNNNYQLDKEKIDKIKNLIKDVYYLLSNKNEQKNEIQVYRCLLGCELLGLDEELKLLSKKINLDKFNSEISELLKKTISKINKE